MKFTKITNILFLAAMVFSTSAVFQSCSNDDDDDRTDLYPNALVTVKPLDDQSFFLQLDENTTLFPVNMTKSPFGSKEVRALVNFEEVDKTTNGYDKSVSINWIDSIRTKNMVLDMGEENDEIYGNDAVEIVKDWVTIAEDGYLTLRFRTIWGNSQKPHYVNLLASDDPEKPYEVEFRHSAEGDTNGYWGDALVAFRLDQLPDTNGETVKLKLKWKSFSGDKSTEFNYCTRVESSSNQSAITGRRYILNVK